MKKDAGSILKSAREARGLSLDELSSTTRINRKFLEEIESDARFTLPEVYLRTFVRTYARALGLDANELLMEEPSPVKSPDRGDQFTFSDIAPGPPVETGMRETRSARGMAGGGQIRTTVIIVVLLITAFILAVRWLWWGGDDTNPSRGQVIENAKKPAPGSVQPSVQGANSPGAVAKKTTIMTDSLTLSAVTTDSVWLQVVIDNSRTVEYMLPPQYALNLKAGDNFLLAVGNPSGLSLSLNGKRLDVLGEGRRPKKNILLSRKLLLN